MQAEGHFTAQVLKNHCHDPFVGRINLIKVFRGVLKPDTAIINVRAGKGEKFGNISIMRGKSWST